MRFKAPAGYSSVSAFLTVETLEKELEFLHAAFGAEAITRVRDANGNLIYVEARIGDSIIMLEHGRGDRATRSAIYIWTDDADAAYQRALRSGAAPVKEPADQPIGIREAGVQDPEGTTWWIGEKKVKMPTREIERALMEQRKSRL